VCSRVQPRKVTIEKKDEINEYKKKEIQNKKGKDKKKSVTRPLSWNIYVKKQCRHINRAGDWIQVFMESVLFIYVFF
jgi:hypothetical protein